MASPLGCAGAWFLLLLLLLLQTILLGLLPSLPPCTAEQVLIPAGDALSTLHVGQYLEHLAYKFKMQDDCNLVLYDNGMPIWSTETAGKGEGCSATITSDGHLVVRDGKGGGVWKSQKSDRGVNYVLVLQPDRNVVIYNKPEWATGTFIPAAVLNKKAAAAGSKGQQGTRAAAGSNMTNEVPTDMGV